MPPRLRKAPGSAPRRGAVLVFFAIFFLAFFGLFAVVVDLGIARTTQLQMQTSADVAALAGLSGRDAVPGDPAAADLVRRQLAAGLAAAVFDEDLDRGTANVNHRLGAGLVLDTGVGGVADPAGGLLVAGAPWVPALQSNAAENLASGDLVAGAYAPVDPADPGRVDWHREANDYTRRDFAPATGGPAFLARLRRTRPGQPLDRVPDVSSAGPTLPYLFGLGSAALATPDPAVHDPRRDGITVRAAAIADGRRVTAAGLARGALVGLAPLTRGASDPAVRWLSLDEASWAALPEGATVTLEVEPTRGAISGTASGFAVVGEPRLGAPLGQGPVTIPLEPTPELSGLVYATLHALDPATGALRVRGFVPVSILGAEVTAAGRLRLDAFKLGSTVAPRNASAQPAAALDLAFGTPAPQGPALLAPVLAR